MLRPAWIGCSHRSDLSVRPGLLANPLDGVVAIAPIIAIRPPMPFRTIAAANVLRYSYVASRHEILRPRLASLFAIRCPLKNHWELPFHGFAILAGTINIAGELHAI